MPKDNPPQPSEELVNVIFEALDHGLGSIDNGAGPLVPFLLKETDGKGEIHRFVTERLEDGVAEARKAAREAVRSADFVTIAWDGYLRTDGGNTKEDAIFVAAADSSEGPTFTFCQRYKYKADGKTLELVGNPAYVACDDGVFTS